jgi:hypothetical protein
MKHFCLKIIFVKINMKLLSYGVLRSVMTDVINDHVNYMFFIFDTSDVIVLVIDDLLNLIIW